MTLFTTDGVVVVDACLQLLDYIIILN
jgi:hypothetical protein